MENIKTELKDGIQLITLNRPKALNALNAALLGELLEAFKAGDANENVRIFVLTGSEKAFAAGADIKEMSDKTASDSYALNVFPNFFTQMRLIRKPILAAVNGFALGGGCELAMLCDAIYAGEKAKFGQPEIKLGVLPGMGGSQNLTRFIGKAKAMDMCLTGRMMGAEEAERAGLVARIFPVESLVNEVMKIAAEMAAFSLPSLMMNKEAVNAAYETLLAQGLMHEQRIFTTCFGTEDKMEGMQAFMDKRAPNFTDS